LNPATKQFLDRTRAVSLSKPFHVDEIRRLVPLHAAGPGAGLPRAEVALRS
jgi:hypothetical protein